LSQMSYKSSSTELFFSSKCLGSSPHDFRFFRNVKSFKSIHYSMYGTVKARFHWTTKVRSSFSRNCLSSSVSFCRHSERFCDCVLERFAKKFS